MLKRLAQGLAVAALVVPFVVGAPQVASAASTYYCNFGYSDTTVGSAVQRSASIYGCTGATAYQPRLQCTSSTGTASYFYGGRISSGTSTANCPVGYSLNGLTVLYTSPVGSPASTVSRGCSNALATTQYYNSWTGTWLVKQIGRKAVCTPVVSNGVAAKFKYFITVYCSGGSSVTSAYVYPGASNSTSAFCPTKLVGQAYDPETVNGWLLSGVDV
jgi:hypothetical protein